MPTYKFTCSYFAVSIHAKYIQIVGTQTSGMFFLHGLLLYRISPGLSCLNNCILAKLAVYNPAKSCEPYLSAISPFNLWAKNKFRLPQLN